MVGGAAALRVGAVALPKTTPLHAPGEECVRHDLIYRKTFCRKGKKKQLQMRSHHYLRREAISTNYRVRLSVCLLHFNILRNAYFLLGELVYLLSKIINGLFPNLINPLYCLSNFTCVYIHIFFFFSSHLQVIMTLQKEFSFIYVVYSRGQTDQTMQFRDKSLLRPQMYLQMRRILQRITCHFDSQ